MTKPIYHANAANTYASEDGSISPMPGALQLIFCDRGTPKPGGAWSFYDGMRDHMIELGVPAEKIAYIHDAKTAQQKQALSAACVSGQTAVLIGSTEKMGTGMNVQARLVALHHVDVPWRPADLEQREGRIIRQGNQNDRIDIFTYVTEATTDTVMWAKVESKAQFIEQAKSGQLDESVTSVEDVSEESLSAAAAATKAAATGDPRFIALVENEERLKELRAPMTEQFTQVSELDALEVSVQRLRRDIEAQQNTPEAIARRADAEERMRAAGRRPGWSLELNPSKKMVAESDFESADEYVAAAARAHARSAVVYARDGQPESIDERSQAVASRAPGLQARLLDDLAAAAQALPDTDKWIPGASSSSRGRSQNQSAAKTADRDLGL